MLKIRKEQMEALKKYSLENFVTEMALYLNKRFPEKAEPMRREQIKAFIHKGIEAADTYQVVKKYDVKRFLEYLLQYGEDFPNVPKTLWAAKILKRDDLSGTQKMDKIDDYDIFIRLEL